VVSENKVETILSFLEGFFDSKELVSIETVELSKNLDKLSEDFISNFMSLKVPETGTFFSVLKPVHFTPKSPLSSYALKLVSNTSDRTEANKIFS